MMHRISRIFYTWLIVSPPAYLFASLVALTRGIAKPTITYLDLQFLFIAFGIITVASLCASVFLNFMARRYDDLLVPMVQDLLNFWIKIVPGIAMGFIVPLPFVLTVTDAGLRTFYTMAAAFLSTHLGCWTIHSIFYILNKAQRAN